MASVLFQDAKTGPMQLALVDDPICYAALRRAHTLALHHGIERIFRLTYARMLEAMRSAATAFGLLREDVATHSCRHGGALSLFLYGTPAKTIAQRYDRPRVNPLPLTS